MEDIFVPILLTVSARANLSSEILSTAGLTPVYTSESDQLRLKTCSSFSEKMPVWAFIRITLEGNPFMGCVRIKIHLKVPNEGPQRRTKVPLKHVNRLFLFT